MSSENLPQITLSPEALLAFRDALVEAAPDEGVLLDIDERFRVQLGIGRASESTCTVEVEGVRFFLSEDAAGRADGLSIDYRREGTGGFKIDNPNAPPSVIEISPAEFHARREAGEFVEFFDVRTIGEREVATLGARLLDDAAVTYILGLDRDTPLAFHCHHGVRSRSAAEHFRDKGFRKVYNLSGGIDAWSLEIDPKVPRY